MTPLTDSGVALVHTQKPLMDVPKRPSTSESLDFNLDWMTFVVRTLVEALACFSYT